MAVPVVAPGVVTVGGVFHLTVVSAGKPVFSTLPSASGTCPLSTVCGLAFGL